MTFPSVTHGAALLAGPHNRSMQPSAVPSYCQANWLEEYFSWHAEHDLRYGLEVCVP
jgi:hypothetical protein